MISAATEKLIDLTELVWPITARYTISFPDGLTQASVTVEAPELVGNVEASHRLGIELFRSAIASAMTRSSRLEVCEAICWKGLPAGIPLPVANVQGTRFGTATKRHDSGCLVLHTGHADQYARRRLILPGIPSRWVSDGLLKDEGRGAFEDMAHAMVMGMCGHLAGGPMVWLLAYPDVLPPAIGNPSGCAFRRVEFVRVCWHTEKAPDPSFDL